MLLKYAREKAGFTQTQLEKRLKSYKGYVSKYETSERELTVSEFVAVSEALDLDPLSLLKEVLKT